MNAYQKRTPNWMLLVLALGLWSGAPKCLAQTILASGQITGAASGLNYNYSISVADSASATSPIGSFWFAWVPGQFYLPSVPLSALAPSGWNATISGHSIQFVASGLTNYIAPGASLSGFGFTSADTPAQIAGNAVSQGFSGTPVATTVVYAAGLFSSPSQTVVFSVVPEPSTLVLAALGALGGSLIGRGLKHRER